MFTTKKFNTFQSKFQNFKKFQTFPPKLFEEEKLDRDNRIAFREISRNKIGPGKKVSERIFFGFGIGIGSGLGLSEIGTMCLSWKFLQW